MRHSASRPQFQAPTPGDLGILSVLWETGSASLSEVHARLPGGAGYTTVQTRLNRLVEKGLARRFKEGRQPSKYAAIVTRDEVGAQRLESVVEHVTRGDLAPLVAQLVRNTPITEDDLKELKAIVKQAELKLQQQRERT